MTFWFEMIDESCFVINDRRSVLSKADILIRVATSVIEYGLLQSIFILATVRYDMMAAQRWILTAFSEYPHRVFTVTFCLIHLNALCKAYHKAFRAMKSSGFNIEDTHLRDRGRIARLFAMVCIALVWAYLVGEHKDIYVKPIKILKHGRRAKSLVKYGLEEISNVLFRPTYAPKFDVFKFLSCT